MTASPSPENKSNFWRNLLLVMGVAAAIVAFFVAVAVILVWQSVSWLKNAAEPAMAQYEELKLSPGEEEDVNRVINGINEAKQKGTIYDEYITPRVFSGAVQKIIDDERRKGKAKPDTPLVARGSFAGERLSLRLTLPAKPGQTAGAQPQNSPPSLLPEGKYINAEVVFDLEIVEGEVLSANVHRLVLRGREAPWLSRMVVNYKLGELEEESHKKKNDSSDPFWAIKLLRREGDRLHVMLDGTRMKEKEQK